MAGSDSCQNLFGEFNHLASMFDLLAIVVASTKNRYSPLAWLLGYGTISVTSLRTHTRLFWFPYLPQEVKSDFLYAAFPLAFGNPLSTLLGNLPTTGNCPVGSILLSFLAKRFDHRRARCLQAGALSGLSAAGA